MGCHNGSAPTVLLLLLALAILSTQYKHIHAFDHAGIHEFVLSLVDQQSEVPHAPLQYAIYLKLVTFDSSTRIRGFLQHPAEQNATLGDVRLQARLVDGRPVALNTSQPFAGDLQPISGAIASADVPFLDQLELSVGPTLFGSLSIDQPLETSLPASAHKGEEQEYVVVTWADQRTAATLLATQVKWHTALGFDRVVVYAGLDVLPLQSAEVWCRWVLGWVTTSGVVQPLEPPNFYTGIPGKWGIGYCMGDGARPHCTHTGTGHARLLGNQHPCGGACAQPVVWDPTTHKHTCTLPGRRWMQKNDV